jgi:hypothetical protein
MAVLVVVLVLVLQAQLLPHGHTDPNHVHERRRLVAMV